MIKGKGVSAGVGFGNTVILKNEKRKIEKTTVEDSNAEMDRLKKAIEEVAKETEEIVNKSTGTEKEIMSAYLMILQDPALTQETENGIKLNTSTFVNSDKIIDNLTITNIQLTYSSGVTSLTANVTNNSNIETPITTITTILKDENKKEICKAKGVVKALGVGETGRINISMSGNFITAYDIEFSK